MDHAATFIGTLSCTLFAVLGWLGTRIFSKLDELAGSIESLNLEMVKKLSEMQSRVDIIEIKGKL